MTKQVTDTISFILHEDPRVGAAQYDTVKLLDVTVVEVEE